jgi:hypothetical protein
MSRARTLAFKIATPLLMLLLAEAAVRYVFDIRGRLSVAARRSLTPYQGVPWADQYFKDLLDCDAQSARRNQPRYARFILQDINEDCATPTVNYANRLRKTWNPDQIAPGTAVKEVAMFGGSTMEGQGAIDDETIPSHFSRLANASGGGTAYHVTNFGVGGYTFTQSVFKFLTLLRDGHRFDYVIFYDGANDIDYAYETGQVGGLFGEEILRTKLEGSFWDRLREGTKAQINACVLCLGGVVLVRRTPILRDYLAPGLVRLRDAVNMKRGQSEDGDVAPFADAIARYYTQSQQLLAKVADAQQVPHIEFWQPSLMFEDRYAPGEERLPTVDPRLTDERLRKLYALTRDGVVKANPPHFVDISHALDRRTQPCYLDAVHLSGACNGLVAQTIFEIWKPITEPAAGR